MKRGTGIGHAQIIPHPRLRATVKACPFDGRDPVIWGSDFPYVRRWIACECGAKSPRRGTVEDAIEWWNRRP